VSAGTRGIVRRLHAAFAARDEETVAELVDPEIVWFQNPRAPDPRTLYGYEGLRQLRAIMADAFEDIELVIDELYDRDDEVVAVGHMRARGKGSGAVIEEDRAWWWTIRDGRAVRHQTFMDRETALGAARIPS
jgi:ketosteroid isomerase-like protein